LRTLFDSTFCGSYLTGSLNKSAICILSCRHSQYFPSFYEKSHEENEDKKISQDLEILKHRNSTLISTMFYPSEKAFRFVYEISIWH